MRLANSSCDNAGLVHQGTLHQARGPHPVHKAIAYTSADQPVKDVAGSGKVYMDFGTAMEIIVVTVNAYGSTRSNTQIMLRVVSLEEELFDVPRVGNILVTRPSRGYLGLQVQRFRAYSAWSLRSDGREHGGRGFQAGRSGISAARMAQNSGESVQAHAETDDVEVVAWDPCVPILCGFLEACDLCRDCSGPSPDDFRALSRRKSTWTLASSFLMI